MTKVSCDIIQDMLPLYCDDVCSADSRKMIEEHLPECEVCSNMLHQLKSEYTVSIKERKENKEGSAVLGKMAHSWKHSLLKSFLIGISIATIVLSVVFGTYYALFEYQGSMVSPEQVSISAYKLSDTQISIRMELHDGYCGGSMETYVDNYGNLYISVQRTIIKDKLTDMESEIMVYGFNQSTKNYIAIYYGTPDNCKLIWEQGDNLPIGDQ